MSEIKEIEILGPGCPRCQQAHRVVQHVVEEAGLDVEVRKEEGIDRMIELGVLATPPSSSTARSNAWARCPRPTRPPPGSVEPAKARPLAVFLV